MKQFTYTIQDSLGLHARPAGMLLGKTKQMNAEVTIACGEKSANGKKLFALMSMGIRCGDTVVVTIEGVDEENCATILEAFFVENL